MYQFLWYSSGFVAEIAECSSVLHKGTNVDCELILPEFHTSAFYSCFGEKGLCDKLDFYVVEDNVVQGNS